MRCFLPFQAAVANLPVLVWRQIEGARLVFFDSQLPTMQARNWQGCCRERRGREDRKPWQSTRSSHSNACPAKSHILQVTKSLLTDDASAGYLLCEVVLLPATLLLNAVITDGMTGGGFFRYGVNWIWWNRSTSLLFLSSPQSQVDRDGEDLVDHGARVVGRRADVPQGRQVHLVQGLARRPDRCRCHPRKVLVSH